MTPDLSCRTTGAQSDSSDSTQSRAETPWSLERNQSQSSKAPELRRYVPPPTRHQAQEPSSPPPSPADSNLAEHRRHKAALKHKSRRVLRRRVRISGPRRWLD